MVRSKGRDGVHRLNYRCLNENCARPKGFRSIRGKLVFDKLDRVIKERLLSLPDSAYSQYLKEVKSYSDSAKVKLRGELGRAKATKAGYEKRITELSLSLSMIKDEYARQAIGEQVAEAAQLAQEQEQLINQYQSSLNKSTLPAIDKDEFRSILKAMPEKLKAADVFQKDMIVSNLFLKLYFDQQKMTRYLLNEPFASLVALNEFQSGGGGWT